MLTLLGSGSFDFMITQKTSIRQHFVLEKSCACKIGLRLINRFGCVLETVVEVQASA